MTLQFQILSMTAQVLAATVIIAGVLFLLGLIFEKPLTALWERSVEYYEKKKKEEAKRRYTEIQLQKEADRKKVQRIRDNFNKELENTGTICVPYYAVS
ncbi:MAG: hypothetical protein IIX36_02130 [Clostridia bacterium]|nr:hypothetical protein [Clostridia bacterium]